MLAPLLLPHSLVVCCTYRGSDCCSKAKPCGNSCRSKLLFEPHGFYELEPPALEASCCAVQGEGPELKPSLPRAADAHAGQARACVASSPRAGRSRVRALTCREGGCGGQGGCGGAGAHLPPPPRAPAHIRRCGDNRGHYSCYGDSDSGRDASFRTQTALFHLLCFFKASFILYEETDVKGCRLINSAVL